MECPPSVKVCGVLALSSGWGNECGAYGQRRPAVHGLWPQVPFCFFSG
jgi:hypothetical protein